MADLTGTSALTLPKITSSSAGVKYKMYPTSLSGDTTLVADTYLMDANCDCNSYKLTFNCNDGNIVVKRSGDYYHTEQGAIDTTNSSATKKVYWTVKNDDTIGTTLPGSTGSPAVLGGSWGNGTAIGNYPTTMKYWELRWADNKIWLNCNSTNTVTGKRDIQYFSFKNCTYNTTFATLGIFRFYSSPNTCVFSHIDYDNTNSVLGGTGNNVYLLLAQAMATISYINIWDSKNANNDAGGVVYCESCVNTIEYLKIKQSANAATGLYLFSSGTFTVQNSYTSIGSASAAPKVTVKNCLFDNTTGQFACRSSTGAAQFRIFNSVFKSIGTACFSGGAMIITGCRNNIFDSNAKLTNAAFTTGIFGVKNNGYYNNTSEANWTRGPYDETIAATSYSNWTTGTLHSDWITYGPGDGWKCNTANISTGCDTNSFVGINTSTQSHTGSAETATTQALGLAPVFSAFG